MDAQTTGWIVDVVSLIMAIVGVVIWHNRSVGVLHSRINALKDELHRVELESAHQYATVETFKHYETKTLKAIKDLGDRIDRAMSRTK